MALKRFSLHGSEASRFLSEFVEKHRINRLSQVVTSVNNAYLVITFDPTVKIVNTSSENVTFGREETVVNSEVKAERQAT
jgi:hypothetical protein